MFAKVNVPIAGIVENMAWFQCDMGKRYYIFGEGGGSKEADRLGVPLLGQIPLDPPTRKHADEGQPVATLDASDNSVSAAFADLASSLSKLVG
jgi:ATP-binding protein involved in chromosome partitioning